MNNNPVFAYANKIKDTRKTGVAQEHAYRAALEGLLYDVCKEKVRVVNDPKKVAKSVKPDFIIYVGAGKDKDIVSGYIETKDLDFSLDEIEKTDQIKLYLEALSDLIVTNYLEFRRYVNGKKTGPSITIGKVDGLKVQFDEDYFGSLQDMLFDFMTSPVDKDVASSDQLSERLAGKCKLLKMQIIAAKDSEKEVFERNNSKTNAMNTNAEVGPIFDFYKSYRKSVSDDIDDEEFADNLAQTFVYGLFAARTTLSDNTIVAQFNLTNALDYIPRTNPFLSELYTKVIKAKRNKEIENIDFAVEDIVTILRQADFEQILHDFGKLTKKDDPVVHFYETFLRVYDKDLKKDRGVWYTPKPIVKFIVRSIDEALVKEFGKKDGLADKDVVILDPACGTGTFLAEVIEQCKEHVDPGDWRSFVPGLLGRLFGFEIMVAPYTIAHLKISLTLSASEDQYHYNFGKGERINVVLTNTLEEPKHSLLDINEDFLRREVRLADDIKSNQKVIVILGNPPYSVSSQNKNDWIDKTLMDEYKKAVKGERNIQPLSDDYIKFVRFAHWKIAKTGHGIIGMITNHSFLSGLIHRGMRNSLLKDFDNAYILDLHGNSKLKETAPDGRPDKNVFDIQQGVAISVFVKHEKPPHPNPLLKGEGASKSSSYESSSDEKTKNMANVLHTDVWGTQAEKFELMCPKVGKNTIYSMIGSFKPIPVSAADEHNFLVPKDFGLLDEYGKYAQLTSVWGTGHEKEDQSKRWASGIKTHRDHFVIDMDKSHLEKRIAKFADMDYSDMEIRHEFELEDNADFELKKIRKNMNPKETERFMQDILYRPFDKRSIYYNPICIDRARPEVMRHMLLPNVAFATRRRMIRDNMTQFFVSDKFVSDGYLGADPGGREIIFPLYFYPSDIHRTDWEETYIDVVETYNQEKPTQRKAARVPNLSRKFIEEFSVKLGAQFVTDGKGNITQSPHLNFPKAEVKIPSPSGRRKKDEGVSKPPTTSDTSELLTFGPEDFFNFVYATFHSREYRRRYIEFLKIDFPRVPFVSNKRLFASLALIGEQLANMHLMSADLPKPAQKKIVFMGDEPDTKKDCVVTKPRFENGRVYINEKQYFDGVPQEAWEFMIGGYQPAQKWLKDRGTQDKKPRMHDDGSIWPLSKEERDHYKYMIYAIMETMRLMDEVDKTICEFGGWPIG